LAGDIFVTFFPDRDKRKNGDLATKTPFLYCSGDPYIPNLALRLLALADLTFFLTLGLLKNSPLRISASKPSLMHLRLKILNAFSKESLS
jgi:hypothetical protein